MTANKDVKIGGLLLAAGSSSRLGQPKQLVRFEGKTLIRSAGEMLAASVCDPVAVVLGAEIEESRCELEGLDISICVNDLWNVGISSSIKSGLRHLLSIEPDMDAVVIALCDQPFVTAANINSLAAEFRPGNASIVASGYGGVAGVPAAFSRSLFDELLSLKGDKGARELIRNRDDVITINLSQAAFDIDTPDDLSKDFAK